MTKNQITNSKQQIRKKKAKRFSSLRFIFTYLKGIMIDWGREGEGEGKEAREKGIFVSSSPMAAIASSGV